jgi:hypothetical protein
MDACAPTSIKKLDDCFGQFLVRVVCKCGTCREIEPEGLRAPGRLVVDPQGAGATDALLEVWKEGRGGRRSGEAKAAGHPEEY